MKALLLFLLCASSTAGFSQTTASVIAGVNLPAIALLDIEPAGSITLNFTSPAEAGNSLGSSATNNTKWLNFTSAVATGATRKVTAQISGTIPAGVRLALIASGLTGGDGTRGSSAGSIYLSNSPQSIVTGIGGGYTGTGTNAGYNLSYSLNIQNYTLLKSGTYTVSVLFTLDDI